MDIWIGAVLKNTCHYFYQPNFLAQITALNETLYLVVRNKVWRIKLNTLSLYIWSSLCNFSYFASAIVAFSYTALAFGVR